MSLGRWYYIVRLRLRSIFRRDRAEAELAEEIRFHLEERERDLMARGMAAADAHTAALRAFGGVEQRKEECRDARRVGWVDDLMKDIVYGLRVMRRSPGFTAVAALSLAIGIGANTAIFTVFDALVLRPLPVDRPAELRTGRSVIRIDGRSVKSSPALPYPVFRNLHSDRSVFSELLAFSRLDEPVVGERSRILRTPGGGLAVSPNFFTMLGVRAQLGRLFEPQEGSSSDQAVVLSDQFWHRDFGADPQILGKALQINGDTFSVIGVAPQGFFGLAIGRAPDFFITIVPTNNRANVGVHLVGRLKPGITDAIAAQWLTASVQRELGAAKPNQPLPVMDILPVDTGLSEVRERFAEPLSILMIMVALLLLVAAANVATMLLARASARRTEMLIRSSIGAGRSRLLRQLTTESLLLVMLATAGGVLLASWGTRALLGLMQYLDAPLSLSLGIDARVLLFTIGVSAVTALVTGLAPALHTARQDTSSALKDRYDSVTLAHGGRLGRSLVIGQVALSLTLVAAAGLLARTLHGLSTIDAGFSSDRVVLLAVNPGARGYQRAELATYFNRLSDQFRRMPSVERASLVQFSFLTDARTTGTFNVPGYVPASGEDRFVQVFQVGADFFATMRIPIVEGRDFTDPDMTATILPVAVNEAAARRFFGTEDAVGRTMFNEGTGRQFHIISVVKDGRYNTLRDETSAVIFVPYASSGRNRMTYVVRMAGPEPPARHLPSLLNEVRAVDPLVPVEGDTLDAVVARSLGQERLLATIAAFFGLAALLLMSLGLYGVMAFWVTARTPEIGVRLALGARRPQVVWGVVRRPLWLVVVGLLVGVGVTMASARLVSNVLFGLAPQDPLTIGGAIAFLMAIATVAGALPARRACRIDPVAALRCE